MKRHERGWTPGLLGGLLLLGLGCTKAHFQRNADGALDAVTPGDAIADTGPAGDAVDLLALSDAGTACPAPDVQNCTSLDAGICDPVCQTGACNWCEEKCTYPVLSGLGSAEPVCTRKGTLPALSVCSFAIPGAPQEPDLCAQGSYCMLPGPGDAVKYCFNLCHVAGDCPGGVACGERKLAVGGVSISVCDPPYTQCGEGNCCDPLATNQAANGCDPGARNQVCLLVSPDPETKHSRTVCEFSDGNGRNGDTCTVARECFTGYTCYLEKCRRVCNGSAPCPGKENCVRLGDEFGCCI